MRKLRIHGVEPAIWEGWKPIQPLLDHVDRETGRERIGALESYVNRGCHGRPELDRHPDEPI